VTTRAAPVINSDESTLIELDSSYTPTTTTRGYKLLLTDGEKQRCRLQELCLYYSAADYAASNCAALAAKIARDNALGISVRLSDPTPARRYELQLSDL
jgi:hypothetical protein